jgi:GT2 family glycosyltransferase
MLLSTGQVLQLFGFGYSREKGDKDTDTHNNLEKISYASGTCLFTTKKILEKLNFFDPFLFAYHDDLDLCWRAAMIGISSFYVPTSIIYHPIEGYSFKWSSFKFYLMERNRQYCLLTHFSKSTYFKMLPALILTDIAVSCFYFKKGMLIAKLNSSLNILKNIKKINSKYYQIQNQRKYSDKEILNLFKDEIAVPKWVISEKSNTFFNKFLNQLSKFTRKFI